MNGKCEIKKGDSVKLKGQSVKMTVLDFYNENFVTCGWFNADNNFIERVFHINILEKVITIKEYEL